VVTFSAPGSNGGSPISSYTVTAIDATTAANGGQTAVGAASPITISGLTNGDRYTFTVKATNDAGTGQASVASLAVIVGSPAAPTGVKAVPGSTKTATGSLTVTFTLAANNGSAITSQKATCTSSNGGATRTGTHSGTTAAAITVALVTTGKTYTCTVTTTNTRGASPASSPSLPVIVGSPAAPTGVTAAHVAAGQIKVKFSPGANNGSVITSFTARCASSNGGATRAKSGAASPLVVVGLTAGRSYACTVTATNARGTSLTSSASGQVTA
jgi:Fibronectin type III domain